MIEPRGIRLHLHRRESSQASYSGVNNESLSSLMVEHEEPETPIHPGFEYEVLAAPDDPEEESSAEIEERPEQAPPPPQAERKWSRHKRNLKLLISLLLMVVSGTGNVVAMKLQAIPM